MGGDKLVLAGMVLLLAGCYCGRETPEQTVKRMQAECAVAFHSEADVTWCVRNRLAQRP